MICDLIEHYLILSLLLQLFINHTSKIDVTGTNVVVEMQYFAFKALIATYSHLKSDFSLSKGDGVVIDFSPGVATIVSLFSKLWSRVL